jgi:drug/metabolite transporter (DMT)-like permease
VQRALRWLAAREYRSLLAVGLLQGFSIAAKNESLLFLSVSKRTMIFALNVMVVMFLARLFGLEQLGKEKLAAASLLVVGGVLQEIATLNRVQGDAVGGHELIGCSLAMAALLMDAFKWVLLQAVFAGHDPPAPRAVSGGLTLVDADEPAPTSGTDCRAPALPNVSEKGMSKLRAVSGVMLAGVPVCAVMTAVFEPEAAGAAQRAGGVLAGRIVSLSVGVAAINVAEFGLVEWTSAVTFNVLANLHSIPVVMAGVLLFAEEVVALEMVGFLACVVSALVYSWAKEKEKRQRLLDDEVAAAWIADSESAGLDSEPCL